jgi:cell division protein FtsI/penicillin-binding protein 2
VLGLSEQEVRAEMLALLKAGMDGATRESNGTQSAPVAVKSTKPAPPPARAAAKKSTAKKGR